MSDRFNHFQLLNVTATGYSTDFANFGFHSTGFFLVNRGAVTVTYSFDGTNDHGVLLATGSADESAVMFHNRMVDKIFFKVASGSAIVRIEAWGVSGR